MDTPSTTTTHFDVRELPAEDLRQLLTMLMGSTLSDETAVAA